MANRLAQETSPYLLEHANNPVDWYPWGTQALAKARSENKPILLSIGYSACHWCHVMARESFEDREVAALMNRDFISIKVDREERPDLDQVYMRAVQGLTGSGGWPMTVFLLPDGAPFFAGTYFPPSDRFGMPSFRRVLGAVAEAFAQRPAEVEATAAQVRDFLERPVVPLAAGTLTAGLLDEAYDRLRRDHDAVHGGFGGAPKFPQPMAIEFLLHQRPQRRPGGPGDGEADPACDGRRWHVRPARRRISSIQRRRALVGPALRKDAVRQRPARPGVPGRLAADPRTAISAGGRRNPRVRHARDDRI